MAKCHDCKKEMSDPETESCTFKYLIDSEGNYWPRDTEHFDAGDRCHDCNIDNKRGNVHHCGCDMERCPKCGDQLISCNCWGDTFQLSNVLPEGV